MAKYIKDIVLGFRGKVGDKVGCKTKTGYYVRRLAAKSTKPPTVKQLAQRNKFKLAQAFLGGLRELFKMLPGASEKKPFAYAGAVSHFIKEAITGEFPEQSIDFAAVRLTSGPLFKGSDHLVRADPGALTFNWSEKNQGNIYPELAVLLAYSPLTDQWIYQIVLIDAATHMATMNLPFYFQGDKLETWLYFLSLTGESVSDSVYTGCFLIPSAEENLIDKLTN